MQAPKEEAKTPGGGAPTGTPKENTAPKEPGTPRDPAAVKEDPSKTGRPLTAPKETPQEGTTQPATAEKPNEKPNEEKPNGGDTPPPPVSKLP